MSHIPEDFEANYTNYEYDLPSEDDSGSELDEDFGYITPSEDESSDIENDDL
jgi:hypothetical protein